MVQMGVCDLSQNVPVFKKYQFEGYSSNTKGITQTFGFTINEYKK